MRLNRTMELAAVMRIVCRIWSSVDPLPAITSISAIRRNSKVKGMAVDLKLIIYRPLCVYVGVLLSIAFLDLRFHCGLNVVPVGVMYGSFQRLLSR